MSAEDEAKPDVEPDPVFVGWKLTRREESESWSDLSFIGIIDYGPGEEAGEPYVDADPSYKLNLSMPRDEAPPVSLGEIVGVHWDFVP